MDKKLIIVRYQGRILTALMENGRAAELHCDEEQRNSLLGNIYIGKVKNIVKISERHSSKSKTGSSATIPCPTIKILFILRRGVLRICRQETSSWFRYAGRI